MKFTIARTALLRGLKLASSTADAKSPQPMLACVSIATKGARVDMSATDLTVGMTSSCAAKVETAGAVAVDARAILDRVSSIAGDDVTVIREGSSVEIVAGRSRFRVPCMDARDFPKILSTDAPHVEHDADDVVAGFAATLPAVCHDATRFHLGGVFVDGSDFVATDGHRLLTRRSAVTMGGKRIVPTKGVIQIMKMIGDTATCEIAWSDAAIFVRVDGVAMSVKLIDAQFPPWQQAVPTSGRIVSVHRHELADVIDRARKVAGDSDAVVMSFDAASNEIAVSAHHADRGDYTDAIGIAEGKWDGSPLAIHFNGRYVAEALNTSGAERADLMMPPDGKNAELMPFVVVLGETRGTIMPMRPK